MKNKGTTSKVQHVINKYKFEIYENTDTRIRKRISSILCPCRGITTDFSSSPVYPHTQILFLHSHTHTYTFHVWILFFFIKYINYDLFHYCNWIILHTNIFFVVLVEHSIWFHLIVFQTELLQTLRKKLWNSVLSSQLPVLSSERSGLE